MQEDKSKSNVEQLLNELDQALSDERKALIQIDGEEIERTAGIKVAVSEALMQRRSQLNDTHRERIKKLEADARHNIILLASARDQIRSRLDLLTGRPSLDSQAKAHPAEGLRLDVRG